MNKGLLEKLDEMAALVEALKIRDKEIRQFEFNRGIEYGKALSEKAIERLEADVNFFRKDASDGWDVCESRRKEAAIYRKENKRLQARLEKALTK